MNYYRKNRQALLKKAHDKYHNRGGKEKQLNIVKKTKKKLKRKKQISTKICQKMKKM